MAKNPLEHEKERFRSMSLSQLRTRLGRITKYEKLVHFIQVADETGQRDLATQAISRLSRLYPDSPVPQTISDYGDNRRAQGEKPKMTGPKKFRVIRG